MPTDKPDSKEQDERLTDLARRCPRLNEQAKSLVLAFFSHPSFSQISRPQPRLQEDSDAPHCQ